MSTVSPPSFNASFHPEGEDCPYVYPAVWVWRKSYLTEYTYRNLVAIACINILSVVPTILFNALVIFVVATRHRLQSNTNILLACLAVTDLLTGLVAYPLAITLEVKRISGVGPFCTLEKLNNVVTFVLSIASLTHLVLISIDRYIAIKYSLRYMDIMTKRRLMTGVLLAWAMTILMSISLEITLPFTSKSVFKRVRVPTIVLFLLVCIAVIIYANYHIFSETRRHRRRIRTEQVTHEEAKRMKKDRKAANTLAIILATLAMTYVPIMVTAVLKTAVPNRITPRVLSGLIWNWVITFNMFSSLLNPAIYCWRVKKLRRAFLEILPLRQPENSQRDIEITEIQRHRPEIQISTR